MTPPIASDYDPALQQRLRNELAEIDELISGNVANSAPVQLDQQSVGRLARMDAMQVQAMAQEAKSRRQLRRHRILQALERIERSDFGLCVECDEPISAGRLNVDPAFSQCVRCAGR